MGAERFFIMVQDEGTGVSLTLKEAEAILKKFHENEPNIRGIFHRDITAAIRSTNLLVCPNGRRRDFFNRIDHHTINEGISFLPQAIVSDQNKFSFIKTFTETPWAYLLCEAHDAGFVEVPSGREIEFYEIYKRNIETAIDFRKGSLKRDYELVIPCEAESGENWGNLKKLEL